MDALTTILIAAFCLGVILAFVASIVYVRRQRLREARQLAELAENRRFYLALIDNNLDTLAVADADGRLRFYNKSLVDLLGFSPESLRTTDFRVHIHPEDRPRFDQQWQDLLEGKDPVNFDPFRYADIWGNYHWKRFITRNMLDDPDIRGFILSSSDITDLIETMDALRLTEQRIRVALNGADIAVFNLDLAGQFTWVFNPLFGHTVEFLMGKTGDDLFPPHCAERFDAMRRRVIAEGGNVTDELDYLEDGERHILSVQMERLVDPNGRVVGVVGSAADITRLRTGYEKVQSAHRMEAIGKLTGGIAHDFNNLLAVIVGNLELLKDHVSANPELSHFVDLALGAADRGAGLTRSLLAFARKQSLDISLVDPNRVLAEIAELMRRSLPPTIRLVFDAAPTVWPCRADPGQLQNAIINLVVNSRDAMPDGGTITISTSNTRLDRDEDRSLPADVETADYVLICVADNGTGMTPDVLEHVFEPFFTTKPVGVGSGLGLPMVYGFAKQIGGHLTLDSAPGKGTRVCFYLPRERAAVRALARGPERGPLPPVRGATILVVDNNEDIRTLTAALLRRSGYRIVEAESGAAAIDRLRSDESIALLITDMLLGPGPNGMEVIHQARALHPDLPVVLMSGYTETSEANRLARPPDMPLLRKPFRRQELEAMVNEALAKAARPDLRGLTGSGGRQ